MEDNILQQLNEMCNNTMVGHLGILFTKWENFILEADMPVDNRTMQPFGLLHGGANLALAETLGSAASILLVDTNKYNVVGLSVTGNHTKSVTSGQVHGIAQLVHKGNTTHIWDIKIYDDKQNLASTSRVTNMILEK